MESTPIIQPSSSPKNSPDSSPSNVNVNVAVRPEHDATHYSQGQGSSGVAVGTSGVSIPPAVESHSVTNPSNVGDSMTEWARKTLTETLAAGNLPSTESLTSVLSAAQSSELLETVKETPLSDTGRNVVEEAEGLLGATERLLANKNKLDDVQQMLTEGALAASKLRESAQMHRDVATTFGDVGIHEEAAAQELMHRMFDVIKLMVSAPEFRTLLRDAAQLALDWLQNVSLATIHDFPAFESTKGMLGDAPIDREAAEKEWDEAARHQQKLRHETMERLLHAFRSIVKRLEDHSAWQQGVHSVLDLFDAVRDRALMVVPSQESEGKEEPSESSIVSEEALQHAKVAAGHAVRLIENFGGNLEPLQVALDELNRSLAHQRPTVDRILNKLRLLLEHPGDEQLPHDLYMDAVALLQGANPQDTEGQEEGRAESMAEEARGSPQEGGADKQGPSSDLVKSGEEIRNALIRLATACREFVQSMRADESVQDVSQSLSGLMQALFIDERTGEPKFKPELMADLQRIVPVVLQRLAVLPIARIDVSTDDVDVILDNVSLRTTILPKDITIATETHIGSDVAAARGKGLGTTSAAVSGQVELKLRNVQVQAPDLVFYYYSRPFPSFADVGIADVTIPGRGLDIDLVLVPAPKSVAAEGKGSEVTGILRVAAVDANVHDIDFKIKRARHNWMYSLARPLVKRIVSRQLERGIERGLESAINTLDRTVTEAMSKSKELFPVEGLLSSGARAMVMEE